MSDHVENIGARARRHHLIRGTGALAIGLLLDAALISAGLESRWFAALFVPFWLGARGLLQAQAATSVTLVARGARNMGTGETPVTDAQEALRFRAQARQIELESMLAATILTGLSLAVGVVMHGYYGGCRDARLLVVRRHRA
jgi:hypothetical protein